ncbi:M14 metallopeptidase family protein [Phenylobacterium sp.]|uniref:M14 metallopeptidase family protein n=1 Tax=Phenylobacterium sp. TaxID=1871053 RepID=UPI0027359EC5|nr:M14 family metallopeptidase [Phenylobacterium sp.]MDP3591285.1 M14 family metallopeptidase [Phenylobacterium sp.]
MTGAAMALVMIMGGGANAAAITPPSEAFAQNPGSDYFLADYTAYEAYLKTLAGQSDRMKLVDIGKSEEGRTQWVAIVSSPANLAKLDHYKSIAKRLAKAEGLSKEEAAKLAAEGKAIVWIDAGMHATETVTSQGQIQVLYRLLSQNDPETLRHLDDVIILYGHDNPDGMELVSDWYMRDADVKKRDVNTIPRLYQKYVGHDNNRDSFMSHMSETTNVNKMLFREWYPQIIYNQHQPAPAGMVVFVPPFRDPFNFNYDPLVMTTLQEVGMAMHSRLVAEDKPGSGARSAAPYSTWHNGMERSVAYFHNAVGLLTEITGNPTPMPLALVPDVQLASNDRPMPAPPQTWHLSQTVEYQWSLNRAVIDYAARNRERLLFNIYKMGANSIQKGQEDSWTTTPTKIDALKEAAKTAKAPVEDPVLAAMIGRGAVDPGLYKSVLQSAETRDPRGYVIPADQADMPTVVTFLNALIKTGVDVDKATKPFKVAGKTYPAGSYVVKTAQAYRPHVLDMFEPQDHPHDLEYPGGPPKSPYDITGYTLAYQMGIKFDRILDGFEAPTERVPDLISVAPGSVKGSGKAGWLISHETNKSFTLTNRLLKAGAPVYWLKEGSKAGKQAFGPGAIWVPASAEAQSIVTASVKDLGIDAYAVGAKPAGEALPLKPVRIGLVDVYGGSMPSGWNRWLFEQFEAPFEVVYPQRLDAGNLAKDFDVLVFADGTFPAPQGGPFRAGRSFPQPKAEDIPAEFRPWLGNVTDAKTLPQLAAFANEGGTLIAVGSSARLAPALGAPVEVAVAKKDGDKLTALTTKEFYIPGSVLRAKVDNRQPLAYGMPQDVDVFFDRSPTFNLKASAPGVAKVSWFDTETPLRSGWAVGQEKLKGSTAVLDIDLGKGKLFVMGPEVTQRAQSYGTFKFLFNGLLYGPAVAAQR